MNLIAYRLPNEENSNRKIYLCGDAERATFSEGKEGVIVSPFSPSKGHLFYPFKERLEYIPSEIIKANHVDLDFKIFTKEEYFEYLGEIIRTINKDSEKKIVASRRATRPKVEDPEALFNVVCQTYPEAFIFLISTKEFGTWVGASPELLLRREGSETATMALAGTRPLTLDNETSWDEKNIKEQKIVTDFISECFSQNGIQPEVGSCTTKKAGNIEHIMTPITGKISDTVCISRLLSDLSPTPALSGHPRSRAIEIIEKNEGDRMLYGGFLGPLYSNGDFHFNVIIRCAFLSPYESILFAGGGVTAFSEPEAEWQEIENKFFTLGRFF